MSGVHWTKPAQADLARIDDYFAERNVDYADRVGREAVRAGHFLADYPQAGEEVAPDHRRWRVPHTRYILIYRLVVTGIEVLRVRHERENWLADL